MCGPEREDAIVCADDSPSSLLRHYAALEAASSEMLQAARAGDWDSVCHLEGACAVVIAKVRRLAQEHPLRPQEQQERMRILRSIMANDAQIRRICEPLPSMLDARAFPMDLGSRTVH
jgi:flagellar protein FliT